MYAYRINHPKSNAKPSVKSRYDFSSSGYIIALLIR